jgi:transcription-repair coupling factor (superfamily II helicase)
LDGLLRDGVCPLGGLPAPAQAFVAACLRLRDPARPFLVLAPDVRHQEELANDLEAWGCPALHVPEMQEPGGDALPDPDAQAELWTVLRRLASGEAPVVVATRAMQERALPGPEALRTSLRTLRRGEVAGMEGWVAALVAAGYGEEKLVAQRGQFARRGGILDVFSWHAELPVRLEWFGEELDGIRLFDPASQQAVAKAETAEIQLTDPAADTGSATLGDYLPGARVIEAGAEDAGGGLVFLEHGFLQAASPDPVLRENRNKLLVEYLRDWIDDGWSVWLSCNNEGEQQRLRELLGAMAPESASWMEGGGGEGRGSLRFALSPLLRGFVWPDGRLAVLADAEIFARYQTLRGLRRMDRLAAVRSRKQAVDFGELQEGDYVVHVEYGVGLYHGMSGLPAEGGEGTRQVLVLEFAEGARLYVPVEQAYLVSRYVGVGRQRPPLDALGGSRWDRAKAQAEKAIMDYAARLLRVQAERQTLTGFRCPPDTPWQKEFEASFLYEPTADQATAIQAAKQDMESDRPMDRLVCGDVGFGKTEVAIRAAFKAVMGGKQAAFLVPTTVLAQQHYKTLSERMADYPVRIELLSRFVPRRKQNETIRRVRAGEVDILVGTHRVISADVQFKDLGLVVIDEEQRFGVRQKEALKDRFRLVDVLTLSATPIPRTLYMALMGARDMSTIETPPKNRLAVETTVCPFDERVVREAIQRELARGGQVYFLHNRVHSIEAMAERIRFLVPDAKVDVGHGQMDEDELEEVMLRFVEGKTDVLVATTIIESGIDIPNANTIIIDRADRFGLADLYQLRGRVGRAQNRAYAYLMLPRDLIAGDAGKRVQAIRQYSQLGAGFKIAMRDLEIRGAGNLLGTLQSGHIAAIGFDLYCRLLKKAVARLQGGKAVEEKEILMRLDFLALGEGSAKEGAARASIPADYIQDTGWRIAAYRELAETQTLEEWDQLRVRWKDRHGRWPESVELLLLYNRCRINGLNGDFTRIETQDGKLMLTRKGDYVMVGSKFPRLTASSAKAKMLEIEKWLKSFSAAPASRRSS